MTLRFSAALGAAVFFSIGAGGAQADVTLPAVLSENMVIQQKMPVRLWGKADPGEKVTVTMQWQIASTVAGSGGDWSVTLRPLRAGGPYAMRIAGKNTIDLNNVLVGEVWVCSGQSNMEWPVAASDNPQPVIAAANDPNLRLFTVEKRIAATPQADVRGKWDPTTPQTVGSFSAVGYFFGRALRQSLGVPVGLIDSSWGGTRVEAWMSRPVLEANGAPASEFAAIDVQSPAYKQALARYERHLAAWKAAGSPAGPFTDPGVTAEALAWAKPEAAANDWGAATLPGTWELSGAPGLEFLDGAVWFRKEVDVPAAWVGKDLALTLGAIDDHDTTFFNGTRVGATGAETPTPYQAPRRYTVPGALVRAGRNVIAVRAFDGMGAGGFTGPADQMRLAPAAPGAAGEPLSLTGAWRYKVEAGRVSNPGSPPNAANPNGASVLYNGMIAPLVRFPIKGAIWYQGESNAGNPTAYRTLFPAMIRNWRDDWKVGAFPFFAVQLAPFMPRSAEPQESSWAALREAQVYATKALRNVGVAVITDVGEEADIHPRKKQPVGERLALLARKTAYGHRIVASGPTYKNMKVNGNKAVLRFDNVGQGLEARGGPLTGFAVAGADKKWVWASAEIVGDTIVVSSPEVAQPVAVRYGWANFPVVNLWNKDGLPAGPFRTDEPAK